MYSKLSPDNATEKELEKEARYLVGASRYVVTNDCDMTLEFGEDEYAKFCFVSSKDEKGIYMCCQ